MIMKKSTVFWKFLTFGLLILTLAILIPFFTGTNYSALKDMYQNASLLLTLQKTLLNAGISAIALVVFGFFGAMLLLNIPFFSWAGKNLGLLIIPVTLGNISIAFMCKLLLGDSVFFSFLAQGGYLNKLLFLLALQMYQFGLLFVYLFWMQLQNISSDRINYAKANHFSFYQKLKDIYIPHTRNLWLLLSAIGFVFSFYEESKIAYLFKVSEGTNSELITNWLSRNYETYLVVNPEYAKQFVFSTSFLVFFLAVAGLVVVFLFVNYCIKAFAGVKIYVDISHTQKLRMRFADKSGYTVAFIFCSIAITPIILAIFKLSFGSNISHLSLSLIMTALATLISSLIAVLFGISTRLGWKHTLSSFSQRSLPFFVLLLVLLLIPPIVILITGFKWMSFIGYSSIIVICAIWIIGHVILTLPILGGFILFNHFRVSTGEIDYLSVYKLSKLETIKYSFIKRFKAEYLLLFIIAYSFIWNEAALNNLFSDYIPSFVSGLKMLITGRGADYDKAFGYLFVSFALAILSAVIWRYIIEKAHKNIKTEL